MRFAPLLAAVAAGASPWSPPATLGACPAIGTPRVVFPSEGPRQATGACAIVWSASSGCSGGTGARVAPLGDDDAPGPSAIPRAVSGRALAPRGALLASGGPHGQIVIAGAAPNARAGGAATASVSPPVAAPGASLTQGAQDGAPQTAPSGLVIQGAAGGPFSPAAVPDGAGPPLALATAYLGDAALAAPAATGGNVSGAGGAGGATMLRVAVERFFSHGFTRGATVAGAGAAPVRGLTLALDYRSEALAVWTQGDELYARLLPNAGPPAAIQRLAVVSGVPTIAAVLSDDRRAIVAWSERRGAHTSVYVDRSAVGVRFGAPRLLESFRDPDGLPAPPASPSLVRLSSEGVVLAWAGAAGGRWVVRVAPVSLDGVRAVDTIAAGALDARLAAMAPGPDDDLLVLWSEPQPSATGSVDTAAQTLFAARATEGSPGGIAFDERELVAPAGPVGNVSVAFDPDDDRAVAAWRGEGGAIAYSIRGQVAE